MNEPKRLTDSELSEVLSLIKDADSVELKLTVPNAEGRGTVKALKIDPLEAQIRQVVFFDTPELTLNEAGLVVRARRSQGASDDTVVKLRPVVPNQLPAELRQSTDFNVEVDAMPGGFVCSASFKGKAPRGEVKKVLEGQLEIKKLFSKPQRAFYAEHAPDGLALDDLSMLGPITVLKLKWQPADFERPLVGEMWLYPDGSRILELSTKCRPNEAFQVATETRVYLTDRGISIDGEQQTKTRTALEFFASST